MFVQIYIELSEFHARRKKKMMCKTKSSISFSAKLSSFFANESVIWLLRRIRKEAALKMYY